MMTAGQGKAGNVKVNAGERSEMKIDDVAKVFDMLSTGLYSNVPQSIAREIAANARDAHAEKGNLDQPWDITFPTAFNPVFRIRDYGVGLTHEQVMGLYTNLGASTKETSNVGVGKFGIGSKAPFAYIDSFTVISYMNGTKTFYSVVKEPVYKAVDPETSTDEVTDFIRVDADGLADDGRVFEDVVPSGMIPAVYVMGQEDTDEDNGVEVTFPIEGRDVDKFRNAIQRVMFGHEVKPRVVDASGIDDESFEGWKEIAIISEGKGWKLLNGNLEGYRGKAYAKMGCVLYPIDAESIDGLDYEQKRMLEHTMIIDFPLGALDITPSRESLKYGRLSPSGPAIVKRLKGIIEDMTKETLAVYDACDTYWAACQVYREHIRANMPQVILNAIRKEANWKGIALEENIVWKHPKKGMLRTGSLNGTVISGSKLSNITYRFSGEDRVGITPSDKTLIVVEDAATTKRAAARIKYFYSENSLDIDAIVWFKYYGGKDAQEELIRILEVVDGAVVLEAEDLPEPPKNSVTGMRRPVQVRKMSWGSFDDRVDLSPEEFAAGGFYIPLERMEPQHPYNYARPRDMVEVLKSIDAIPSGAPIYGAPKSLWKHFEGDQWVNVYELADQMYASKYDAKLVTKRKAIEAVSANSFMRFLSEHIEVKKLPKGTLTAAMKFHNTVESMPRPNAQNIIRLARAVGKDVDLDISDHNLLVKMDDYDKAIDAEYPMLRVLADHCRYAVQVLDKMVEYVHMCETANAATNQAAAAA